MKTSISTLHPANKEIIKKGEIYFKRALACLLLDQYVFLKNEASVCVINK